MNIEIVDKIRVYRLNNDKVLEWLQKKVRKTLPSEKVRVLDV